MWRLLTPEDHGTKTLTCCMVLLRPKDGVSPSHIHETADELIYIEKGHGRITINGHTYELDEGSAALVEKNEVHMLTNPSLTPLKALCIYSDPISLGDYSYCEHQE